MDILINNASISGIVPQSAVDTRVEHYDEVFNVNVYGVIRVTQAFIGLLKRSEEPRIVNVSTSVGSLSLQSNPEWPAYDYAKYSVYASSKAAMNMYTVHLLMNFVIRISGSMQFARVIQKADFTNYNGGEVEEAGKRIIKYALIEQDGQTGKFFGEESNPETGEIPW